MSLKAFSFTYQGCVHLIKKYSKNSNIVKCYYNLNCCFLFEYVIYSCNVKLNFQHHYIITVFSVTWSSEIILICWFAAQQTFLIIINAEHSCPAKHFFVDIFFWILECSLKEQHLFEIEIFSNIMNVSTVTSGQFNASLLGLHDILHAIVMRISSVKPVQWLAVNLHPWLSHAIYRAALILTK